MAAVEPLGVLNMEVSKVIGVPWGTSRLSILMIFNGFIIANHPFWGSPFMETSIGITVCQGVCVDVRLTTVKKMSRIQCVFLFPCFSDTMLNL